MDPQTVGIFTIRWRSWGMGDRAEMKHIQVWVGYPKKAQPLGSGDGIAGWGQDGVPLG